MNSSNTKEGVAGKPFSAIPKAIVQYIVRDFLMYHRDIVGLRLVSRWFRDEVVPNVLSVDLHTPVYDPYAWTRTFPKARAVAIAGSVWNEPAAMPLLSNIRELRVLPSDIDAFPLECQSRYLTKLRVVYAAHCDTWVTAPAILSQLEKMGDDHRFHQLNAFDLVVQRHGRAQSCLISACQNSGKSFLVRHLVFQRLANYHTLGTVCVISQVKSTAQEYAGTGAVVFSCIDSAQPCLDIITGTPNTPAVVILEDMTHITRQDRKLIRSLLRRRVWVFVLHTPPTHLINYIFGKFDHTFVSHQRSLNGAVLFRQLPKVRSVFPNRAQYDNTLSKIRLFEFLWIHQPRLQHYLIVKANSTCFSIWKTHVAAH